MTEEEIANHPLLKGHLYRLVWTEGGGRTIDLMAQDDPEKPVALRWTEEDMSILADMKRSGAKLSEIANELGRSVDSIINKWAERSQWLDKIDLPPLPEDWKLPERTDSLRLEEIFAAVCRVYGINRDGLLGTGRMKCLTEARHVASWLARQFLGKSYPKLGQVMSRDHATIRHGVLKVEANLPYYREKIEFCLSELGLELVTREAA